MTTWKRLAAAVAWALLLAALFFAIGSAASPPIVYRAWPSGECVAVLGGECASLPNRYHAVWVASPPSAP